MVFTGGLASEYPEPKDKRQFIMGTMYNANYDIPLPTQYNWPCDFSHPRELPEQ